ncbi:DUF4252 domain-containing protein [Snuella lapsa]|uniref:DUF4252 domain-containing protein n=1 Tax=Snuella lapsa TaxID=870481 RepID=A0ABP6YKW4_9FLAO
MQLTIKNIAFVLIITLVVISCNEGTSLQRYFVDHQETSNFISVDLPLSMVDIDKSQFTEDQKVAYNSVKRLNFLGYKVKETDMETYNTELNKVKTILKHKKYNDLIEFSDKGTKVVVKYIGTDERADEVVLFGSSKTIGFGIIRILGDDIDPQKMATLVGTMKNADFDEAQLQGVMDFFK